ncbi:MAG: hypothetical protein GX922_05055 [Firmicutes bacterium]|nr:hypothetical protein [Bacillota bacterium]
MKNVKRNKPLVLVLVIMICGGLVLSTVLAYFVSRTAPQEDPEAVYKSQVAQVETLIEQTEKSLEDDPENVTLLTQLGHSYYTLGQLYAVLNEPEKSGTHFAKALEPYGKVLALEPDNVDVRVDRAVAAYASENKEVAQDEFEQALADDPTHVKAHFNYGIFLYFALNKPEEALIHWQEVVDLNPEGEEELVSTAKTWIKAVEAELAEREKGAEEDEQPSKENETEEKTE